MSCVSRLNINYTEIRMFHHSVMKYGLLDVLVSAFHVAIFEELTLPFVPVIISLYNDYRGNVRGEGSDNP